jgi:tetratricopeptide (TPR) repeat protein
LAFLFIISSFIIFIKHDSYSGKRKEYCLIFSSVLFLLGLFSKEATLAFPALLILYDYFFIFKQEGRKLFANAWGRYRWHLLSVGVYAAAWISLKGTSGIISSQYPYPGGSFYSNMLTMSWVLATYIRWLVLPINIHPFLPENNPAYTLYSVFDPRAFFSLTLVILFLAAAFVVRKKKSSISFSLFWFFILLLPVSNIVPISCVIAGRYLYAPMAGFCIALTVMLCEIYNSKSRLFTENFFKRLAGSAVLIMLISYFMFTIIGNLTWKNNIILWQELVETSPQNPQAHINLANQFRNLGLFEQALNEYRTAIGLDQNLPEAYNQLGIALGASGRYAEAAGCFEKAIEIDNKYLCAYNNLAVNYIYMKEPDKARVILERALKVDPEYSTARLNLNKLNDINNFPKAQAKTGPK